MFMRRRPLLRAAVVGGGAYAAGHHMATRSAGQAQQDEAQNERLSSLEQQQPAPAPEQAPAAAGPSMTDQLNELTTLHQQGALTDAEFTAAKARLLGS
jgi:hypothetical protein